MSQAPDITGTEGERLDATVTVDSTFASQQTQTIELRIEDGGTTVHTETQDVTLADSTDSQQITLSWPTSAGDAGVYDLYLESDQDTIQRLVEVTDSTAATLADNHWRFNEGGGSVAADTIGSFDADFGTALSWGSDGDGNGGTYGVLDGTGGADLGGTSDSHWSHWVNSAGGAIGVWIEPDFTTQPDQRAGILASDIEGSSSERSFAFHYEDTGNLEFQWEDASGTGPDLTASVIQDSTWQAAAVRADGSTVRMYHATASAADISEVASESVSNTESGDLANTVQIAQDNPSSSPDRFAAGGIDDLWSDQSDPGEQAIKDWFDATKDNYQ